MQSLYDYDGNKLDIGSSQNVNISSPEDYGAIGDGIADDSNYMQQTLTNKGYILCHPGSIYKITTLLRIYGNTTLDLNGSVIKCTDTHLFFNFLYGSTYSSYNGESNITIKNGTIDGGSLSFAHGENILLKNVIFKNANNDHFLEICACKNYNIIGCKFVGMKDVQTSIYEYINIDPCSFYPFPWNEQSIDSFYDGTINDGLTISDCYFAIGEGTYAYGHNAIGVHSNDSTGGKQKNIVIKGNTILGFTGCGIRINNMDNVIVANNTIKLTASGSNGIRIGDVLQSTNVTIKGNVITSNGTPITKSSDSTIFESSDNDKNPTYS